jgi:hypothetical protein
VAVVPRWRGAYHTHLVNSQPPNVSTARLRVDWTQCYVVVSSRERLVKTDTVSLAVMLLLLTGGLQCGWSWKVLGAIEPSVLKIV